MTGLNVRWLAGAIVALGLLMLALAHPARAAATLTWDSDGSYGNGVTDGNGTWDTTAGNWYGAGPSDQAWNNGSNDIAQFGTGTGSNTAYSVSLGTGITVGGLTFQNQNYTVSGKTITLAGTTATITTNANGTIGSALVGTSGLTKAGPGTLSIAAAQTYTGPTAVLGGTLKLAGTAYQTATFTTVGTTTWTDPVGVTSVDYLVVGGGGGGGGGTGGGGGAGGFLTGTTIVSPGTGYTITVGGGGAGGTTSAPYRGSNGGNSAFGSILALGGGGGGGNYPAGNYTLPSAGGSGGGGSGANNVAGAAGTGGQGFAGGSSGTWSGNYPTGGGGGAGGVGSSGTTSAGGAGGAGLSSSITGSLTWYAGGGGGGAYQTTNGGAGGVGGGGNGGKSGGGATNGQANTGGGGGGQGGNQSATAGAGGSGIVALRWSTPLLPDTTPLTIAANSTLDLNGCSQTFASLSDYSGAGGSVLNSSMNAGTSSTLILSPASGSTTFSGVIQGGDSVGAIRLIKQGNGTQVLASANTYTGGTTLNTGVLVINNNSALGTGPFTITGGTIDSTASDISLADNAQYWNGDFNFQGTQSLNLGTGAVAMSSNRTVAVSSSNLTVGGPISGSGCSLTKSGAGTLTITGTASTYSGGTTISAGTLQLGDGTTNGAVLGDIVNNSNLRFNNASDQVYGGKISTASGTGSLIKSGAGTLTLGGALTYNGATIVQGGTLKVDSQNASPLTGVLRHYSFEGTSLDVSGNGGIGTLANGASLAASGGKYGSGYLDLSANGNAMLTVGTGTSDAPHFNTGGTNSFTMTAWYQNATDTGFRTLFRTLINAPAGSGDGDHPLLVNSGTNNLGFWGNKSGGGFSQAGTATIPGGTSADNTWHFLAVVGDGPTLSYYTDDGSGGLTLLGTVTKTVLESYLATVGNLPGGGQRFSQAIDDVYIYGRALNVSELGSVLKNVVSNVLPTGTAVQLGGSTAATLDLNGVNQQIASLDDYGGYTSGVVTNSGGGTSATLTLSAPSGSTTFSGIIDNAGGTINLIKAGNSTQVLAGTNTYSGATTINGGTLALGAASSMNNVASSPTISIAAGATLDVTGLHNGKIVLASGQSLVAGGAGTTNVTGKLDAAASTIDMSGGNLGTLAVSSSLASSGAAFKMDVIGDSADQITAASAAVSGANRISLALNSPVSKTYTLISAPGGGLDGGTYSLPYFYNNTNYTTSLNVTSTAVQFVVQSVPGLTSAYWMGGQVGGGNDNVMAASDVAKSNWGSDDSGTATPLVPGASTDVYFSVASGASNQNAVLGADMTFKSLTLNDTTPVTIGGANTLTITAAAPGAGIAASQSATVNCGLKLGTPQTWITASGTTLTVNGPVSGDGGLTKAGEGTLVLSAANTYGGATAVNGGVLNFAGGSLPTGTNRITFGGGTLQWASANSQDISGSMATIPAGQAAILDTNGNTVTLASAIRGDGGLTKAGGGTLVLSGPNTYGGVTAVNGGVLNFASGSLPTGANRITFGGGTLQWATGNTLDVSASVAPIPAGQAAILDVSNNAVTLTNPISGDGGLTKTGVGTLTLTAANTYNGTTAVNYGFLRLNNASGAGYAINGNVEIYTTTTGLGAYVILDADNQINPNATVSMQKTAGDWNVIELLGHTQTIAGINTSGATPWHVIENTQGESGYSNTGTLIINNAGDSSFDGYVRDRALAGSTGKLAIVKSGAGTLTFNLASGTYTGGLEVREGKLSVARLNNQTAEGPLGQGNATLGSAGTTGTLLYTGDTSSSSHDLTLASGGTGAIEVAGDSTLLTLNGAISGDGRLAKAGPGTLILAGANTATGPATINQGTLTLAPYVAAAVSYTFDRFSGSTVYNDGSMPDKDAVLMGGAAIVTPGVGADQHPSALSTPNQANWMAINLTNNRGVDLSGGKWTASAWFYNLSNTSWRTLFRGNTNDHQILVESGSQRLGVYDNATGGNFRASGYDITSIANDGQWHQVTAVGHDGVTDMYVDGGLVGTSDRQSLADIYAIGNIQSINQRFADLIDDVNIYQFQLTADQVAALYNGTQPIVTPSRLSDTASLTIAVGAKLDLAGQAETVGPLEGAVGSLVALSGGTLTVNNSDGTNGVDSTFAGDISGPGSLHKTGDGTLLLSGTNTYDGGTTVTGGTLEIASAGALPAGYSLTIGAGGTLVLSSGLSAASAGAGAAATSAAAVPEPASFGLLAVAALIGAALLRNRNRRA